MVKREHNNILDEKVFDEIFTLFFDKVVCFVASIVKSEDTALDIAQDVFTKLWEKRETVEVKPDFGAYLYVLAKNSALKYLRREKLKEIFAGDFDTTSVFTGVDDAYDAKELLDMVKSCIMAMPEPRREIFILSRKRGVSNKDIAAKFGLSVRTVDSHIFNALSELRQKCFLKKKKK